MIAAGCGSRLSHRGDIKPLIPLLGLSLIQRVILTAHECGLTDFYVVTGYRGEQVQGHLDKFSKDRGIKITHIINDEWQKGNALSVAKAKDMLHEKFILLMADHLFDESILVGLQNAAIADGEVMLAIDHNITSTEFVNVADVTKVLREDDAIRDIGKDIKKYNAYDTRIFLCSPGIFRAAEESMRQGDSSLSGAMRVLAKKARPGA